MLDDGAVYVTLPLYKNSVVEPQNELIQKHARYQILLLEKQQRPVGFR